MSPLGDEQTWMRRALALARLAQGRTEHYPMVGAVVLKAGRVIAEDYFRCPGEPHAEARALASAGAAARGATLVLNLEPCSHFGRTPPCADAVIRAGIQRVVAGMEDPNPLVCGRGFQKLRAAGIQVATGVLADECRELNRVFVKFITTGRPYVIVKAAATLDGKIAAGSGDSFWITGEPARKEAHRLRSWCQAVLVGAGTVRRDDCRLTARASGSGRQPRPVVVTTDLDVPLSARVMKTPAPGGPILFCTRAARPERVRAFRERGALVIAVKKDRQGFADLDAVMRELGKLKIASVLVEGGSAVIGSVIRAGLADEVQLFVAPKLLGGDGVPIARGPGPKRIAQAIQLENLRARKVGADLLLSARVKKD